VQPDGTRKEKKESLFGYGSGIATYTDPVSNWRSGAQVSREHGFLREDEDHSMAPAKWVI
jgi:hypothetical protein